MDSYSVIQIRRVPMIYFYLLPAAPELGFHSSGGYRRPEVGRQSPRAAARDRLAQHAIGARSVREPTACQGDRETLSASDTCCIS